MTINVGNPLTPWPSQRALLTLSSAVQSTWPILTAALSSYEAANCSQVGASLLQCPHHGAKNLTKTVPSLISWSKLSLLILRTEVGLAASGTFPSSLSAPAAPLLSSTKSLRSLRTLAPL